MNYELRIKLFLTKAFFLDSRSFQRFKMKGFYLIRQLSLANLFTWRTNEIQELRWFQNSSETTLQDAAESNSAELLLKFLFSKI